MSRSELHEKLLALNLHRLAEDLDDFLARAIKQRLSPEAVVEQVVRLELAERERRSLERRMKRSRLGRFKPMADFDWAWPTLIEKDPIERALSGALVKERGNLVLVAAQGLGKTMIARNIAHNAVLAGHSALFVEAAQMLLDLGSRDSSRALEHRLRHYARPDVLCIDEVGYLSYDARAADLLFQVISRRYQQKSVVITTNLAFKEWSTVFPSAACLVALIDRLTHHADIAHIEGESYRLREAELARKERRATKKKQGTAGAP
jgi:DNA replication protein DnaC